MKNSILTQVLAKESRIGIIGLGYVGLPLALRFCGAEFNVLGFDIDENKVNLINQGKSYIKHINNDQLFNQWSSGKLKATDDFAQITETDVIILCLPTPLGQHNEPDISYISNTIDNISPYLKKGHVISLESSTYPGTTRKYIVDRVNRIGFTNGENIFVLYSPEREDPGNKHFSVQTIPKIVSGSTESCLEIAKTVYGSIVDTVVPVDSLEIAELAKLIENIYRSVNIGLVNELKMIADKMGINIWNAIDAASSKPFGFTPFYPGPGLGGHCIPIDPFYLTWKAKEHGLHTRFIELAGEINTAMPDWVVQKIMLGLNNAGKSVKDSHIHILGISYKKNIDDLRESPALKIIHLLRELGAVVSYTDPYIPTIPTTRKYHIALSSEEMDGNSIQEYDCIVIVTDHDDFDYELIKKYANLIVDTRGRFKGRYKNIVRA